MKIFAQTFTFDPQTPIETISFGHQHGFQGVEITCEYPRGPLDYEHEAVLQMKRLAQEYDMPLLVHAPYINVRLADLNPRIREASVQSVKDGIDFARQIDARIVTMHLGNTTKRRLKQVYESVRKALLNSILTLTEYAEQQDVTIAIENVQTDDKSAWEGALGKRAEEIIDILKEIDSKNIGVTFDVGHANTISDPINLAVKLAPYVVNVHLHDNDGSSDQHLVIGQGSIDFLKILHILKETGYAGSLVLEYFDPDSLVKAKMELLKLLKRF